MESFSKIKPVISERLKLQDQAAEQLRKNYYELKYNVLGDFLLLTFLWWAFYYLGRFPFWTLALPLAFGPIISFLRYRRTIYAPITRSKVVRQSGLGKVLVFFKLAKPKKDTTVEYVPPAWKAYLAALGLNKQFKSIDVEQVVKKAIVQKFLQTLSDSVSYEPKSFIDFKEFLESKIFVDLPEHYTGDDFIEGTIDGIPLKISELQVKKRIPSKNKWINLFSGIFMVATYPRPFKTSLVIVGNDLQDTFGYAARAASEDNPLRMNFIASTDPVFNKLFTAYCQDIKLGEELLAALVPSLLKFYDRSATMCSISLIGDKIYAAINYNKPLFVFNMKWPIWSQVNLKIAYRDFFGIYFLIQTLDINKLVLPVEQKVEAAQEEEWEDEPLEEKEEEKPVPIWKFWKWQLWGVLADKSTQTLNSIKEKAKKEPPQNRWEYLKKLDSRRDTNGDGKEGWG